MSEKIENFKWFLKNRDKLCAKYPKKYIVIVNKKIAAKFVSLDEAYAYAYRECKEVDFIVQRCVPSSNDFFITNLFN